MTPDGKGRAAHVSSPAAMGAGNLECAARDVHRRRHAMGCGRGCGAGVQPPRRCAAGDRRILGLQTPVSLNDILRPALMAEYVTDTGTNQILPDRRRTVTVALRRLRGSAVQTAGSPGMPRDGSFIVAPWGASVIKGWVPGGKTLSDVGRSAAARSSTASRSSLEIGCSCPARAIPACMCSRAELTVRLFAPVARPPTSPVDTRRNPGRGSVSPIATWSRSGIFLDSSQNGKTDESPLTALVGAENQLSSIVEEWQGSESEPPTRGDFPVRCSHQR